MRKKYYSYPNVFATQKNFWLEIFSEEEYKDLEANQENFFSEFHNIEEFNNMNKKN